MSHTRTDADRLTTDELDRQFDRADRKVSRTVRQAAADIMAAEPSVTLGEALSRAISAVALEGQARADAYAAKVVTSHGPQGHDCLIPDELEPRTTDGTFCHGCDCDDPAWTEAGFVIDVAVDDETGPASLVAFESEYKATTRRGVAVVVETRNGREIGSYGFPTADAAESYARGMSGEADPVDDEAGPFEPTADSWPPSDETDGFTWELGPDPDDDGPRLTFAGLIDREAAGYRAWGNDAGDFLARNLEELAQLVRWTHATTPAEHDGRMGVWDDEIRRRHEAIGYEEGRRAGCACGDHPAN